jgi:hypothetical protein
MSLHSVASPRATEPYKQIASIPGNVATRVRAIERASCSVGVLLDETLSLPESSKNCPLGFMLCRQD